jgi:hypothetical protein
MRKLILKESQLKFIIDTFLSEGMGEIDAILDKINSSGMKSLTDKEKKYLDHYSLNNEFLDDEELTTSKELVKSGETWRFDESPGIPSMSFKYEVTEQNLDEIIHSGYFTISGDEYYGEIYCTSDGEYSVCNFESNDGENLFEKYEGLEREIESFLSIICDQLKEELKG